MYAAAWMDLKNIMASERCLAQMDWTVGFMYILQKRQNEGQWVPEPGQKLRPMAKGQEGDLGVMEMFSVVMITINLLNIVNGHLPQVCSVVHKLYFNKAFF